jgi:hypothetical protein
LQDVFGKQFRRGQCLHHDDVQTGGPGILACPPRAGGVSGGQVRVRKGMVYRKAIARFDGCITGIGNERKKKRWIVLDKFEKGSRIRTFLKLRARKINLRGGKLPRILGNLSIPCRL